MFYVIRHGQTEWNRPSLLQGKQDSPLTALGRAHETLLDMAGLRDAVIVIEGRDWRFEEAQPPGP